MKRCEQCGGNRFYLLLGLNAEGRFDDEGTMVVSGIEASLDHTIESMECAECGAVHEEPVGRVFDRFSTEPVKVRVERGVAEVERNPHPAIEVEIEDLDLDVRM